MFKKNSNPNASVVYKREGLWMQAWRQLRKNRIAMLGMIGVIVLVIIAIAAPILTPYSLSQMDLKNIKSGPSAAHWFGTDELGRDYMTRIFYGGRLSLSLGLLASLLSFFIGLTLGSISGFFGGWVDNFIMRISDIIQAIPATLIAITISLAFGPGFVVTLFAMAMAGCVNGIRMTRALILAVRSEEYLEAAKTINCSTFTIIVKHSIPNILSPLLITLFMNVGTMIQHAASLSILGLGVQPPTPEWGAMISHGLQYIRTLPYLIMFPGLFIFLTGLFVNLFGDGLRDAIDPKLRR
jgi:peptide/nickel transport system permease protein